MEHLRAAVREVFDSLTADDDVDVYTVLGAVLARYPAADRSAIEMMIVEELLSRGASLARPE